MPTMPPTFKPPYAMPPRPRAKTAARGYDSKWQRESAAYLAAHPWCAMHMERGERVKATLVNHKIPHRGDQRLFWDRNNWEPVCTECHCGPIQRLEAAGGHRG